MQTREFTVFNIWAWHECNDFFRRLWAFVRLDEDFEIGRYQVKCLNVAL